MFSFIVSLISLSVSIAMLINTMRLYKSIKKLEVNVNKSEVHKKSDEQISFDDFLRDYAPYQEKITTWGHTYFTFLFHDISFGDYEANVYFQSDEDIRKYHEYIEERLEKLYQESKEESES